MIPSHLILVCFAVKEEARPFQELMLGRVSVGTLVTGMGRHNAEGAVRAALAAGAPALVLSAGFAGGLDPALDTGAVVFEADGEARLDGALTAAAARPAQFHCAERIVVTAAEKGALREQTRADAVEMESGVIRAVCREQGVPAATVRVILDTASEDLPLDFNRLLTPAFHMDYAKLALALARAPGKLGALRQLQKQSRAAAERLAAALEQVVNAVAARTAP